MWQNYFLISYPSLTCQYLCVFCVHQPSDLPLPDPMAFVPPSIFPPDTSLWCDLHHLFIWFDGSQCTPPTSPDSPCNLSSTIHLWIWQLLIVLVLCMPLPYCIYSFDCIHLPKDEAICYQVLYVIKLQQLHLKESMAKEENPEVRSVKGIYHFMGFHLCSKLPAQTRTTEKKKGPILFIKTLRLLQSPYLRINLLGYPLWPLLV